jgi:hypothetical protein
MRKISSVGLVFAILLGLSGCAKMAMPNLWEPGSAKEQQNRAIRYDPFPQTDMGGSTTNVRPKSYDKPIAEPSQARWYLNGW